MRGLSVSTFICCSIADRAADCDTDAQIKPQHKLGGAISGWNEMKDGADREARGRSRLP